MPMRMGSLMMISEPTRFDGLYHFKTEIDVSEYAFMEGFDAGNRYGIDWGDGTYEIYYSSTPPPRHAYAAVGTYEIRVMSNHLTAIRSSTLGITPEISRVSEIIELRNHSITRMERTWRECTNLTRVGSIDMVGIRSAPTMFQGCRRLKEIGELLNTELVDSFSYAFDGCWALETIPPINTTSTFAMEGMFRNCTELKTIPEFDVSNVTRMDLMFQNCINFNDDLSMWCVSKIPEEPADFATNTPSWTKPKPLWGFCPSRNDILSMMDVLAEDDIL